MRIYRLSFNLLIGLLLLSAHTVKGQNINNKDSLLNNITDIDKRLKKISTKDITSGFSSPLQIDNSISSINEKSELRDSNGLLILPQQWTPFSDNISFRDTIIFDPALLPVIFDGKILPSDLDFRPKASDRESQFHLISPDNTFAPQLKEAGKIQQMRKFYYTNNPQRIKLNALRFKNSPVITEEVIEKKNPFKELLSTDSPIELSTPEIEKIQLKPVYWLKTGEHSLQINQNYISGNWHLGGEKNYNIQNYHKVVLKYAKKKVKFENTFEWKLNIMQTGADTLHTNSIVEDYFRSYSIFGIEAFKKWSYTINLEVKTPLFNSYPINSSQKKTALFSPLQVNTGIGMRYNLEKISEKDKYRKFNLSMELSPISVSYVYVGDDGVDRTRFGVKSDRKSNTDFGSTINMNLSYSFNRYTSLSNRLKYFTNYNKSQMENETKVNMKLNRFLSTSINLYLRFDDGVPFDKKDNKLGYLQVNEIVGFGLNYTW